MDILCRTDWDVLLPVITLILGIFITLIITFFKDYWDRRRKINNIKKILYTELSDNQGLLFNIKRFRIDKEDHFNIVVEMSEYFSSVVFETYLDRLDSLKENEIEALSTAYLHIRTMKRFIISYSDILEYPERQKKPKDNPLEFVKGHLVNSINKAIRHIFYAMLLMLNEKVPEDANELDITQLEAGIEAEIGEIIG